jgi:thiol:disulfide interchange protein DsbD
MLNGVQQTAAVSAKPTFITIHSIGELEAILMESEGKKVMLDFYADWCISCKEMEHVTFSDPDVMAKMAEFVLIQADVTDNTDDEKELTKEFGLFGPPGIIFFDEKGEQIQGRDIIGYQGPEAFLEHLNKL